MTVDGGGDGVDDANDGSVATRPEKEGNPKPKVALSNKVDRHVRLVFEDSEPLGMPSSRGLVKLD